MLWHGKIDCLQFDGIVEVGDFKQFFQEDIFI